MFFLRYPEGVDEAAGERWYLGTHTQEAKQLRNLRRYRTWKALPASIAPSWTTVPALNRWHRLTELAFDDWSSWRNAAVDAVPAYTAAPYGPRGFESEIIFIDDTADDDFLGTSPPPMSESRIRWLFLLRYGRNTTYAAGEDWYLGTHTREAARMAGLERYQSWKAQEEPGRDGASRWDRLTELAFRDFAAWEESAVRNMPAWTPPPYPQPGFLSETIFVAEQPQYDLLKVVPALP